MQLQEQLIQVAEVVEEHLLILLVVLQEIREKMAVQV
jgi:hypothetical protein